MEVSSLLCLGDQGPGGASAGWPWGLQEPEASILMTWKPARFLHSWKGVLLTCLPTVGTRTRKRKGTDIKATVLRNQTMQTRGFWFRLHRFVWFYEGGSEGSVALQQLRFKSSFRCVTTSADLSLGFTLGQLCGWGACGLRWSAFYLSNLVMV